MLNNKKALFLLFTLALAMVFFNPVISQAANLAPETVEEPEAQQVIETQEEKLPVYFFWGQGCSHCHDEAVFLEKIQDDYPDLEFFSFETWNNKKNYEILLQVTRELIGRASGAVPILVIGNKIVPGFSDEQTTGAKIKQLLDIYTLQTPNNNQDPTPPVEVQEKVKYPLIGEINLKNLSLPLLTIVLGTLDGFNPCSMWALVVLITLLINTGSKKKMWIVGWTFIAASAFSYFIFLTAWLNAFLLVGYLTVVRVIIGLLAVGVGIYFLQDYWKKRKQDSLTCEVTSSKAKAKIIQRLENVLKKKSVLAMIIGVILIAFSVNLIELICSAGIPAIYTQILSQNNLPKIGYYFYLLLYDFFYMIDDVVVLLIAGFTWQLFVSSGKYTKYSHLIGGVLLLILGVIMLINPNILMFKMFK